jgi:hypothetical protein
MSDDNQIVSVANTPISTGALPSVAISQVGDKNTQIAHADNVVVQKSYNIFANPMTVKKGVVQNQSWQPSTEYYNLIVGGSDEYMDAAINAGSILMGKDRVLSIGYSDETQKRFGRLSADDITLIKSFPSIIASENHRYGNTDDDHQAFFGRITDVSFEDNGIRLYFHTIYQIPQQRLNEMIFELSIKHSSAFNELNNTYWSIKRADLLAVLSAAGLRPF